MVKKINFVLLFLFVLLSYTAMTVALSREEKILDRIKPLGVVNLSAGSELAAGVKITLSKDAGIKRYKSTCYICHDTGASGAPKLGDKNVWNARIKLGKETLYNHAIKGLGAMPAKGGCLTCSDEEIKMSVDYMISKAS